MTGKATILWAEDDDNDVFFLKRALAKAGLEHHLVHVPDGSQAVSYLSGAPPFADRSTHPLPQLLLLDLKMPKMSAFDVLAWLQARPDFKSLPAIVLSSSNQQSDLQRAQQLGASDYLIKPAGSEELVDLVRSLDAKWLRPELQTRPAGP